MTFHGWAYPLEAYTRALEDAGLRIETLREPVGTPEPDERWLRLPMFLIFRVRQLALMTDGDWRDGGFRQRRPSAETLAWVAASMGRAVASLVIAD